MNSAIAFWAGCVTFVFMMVLKLPIKKLTRIVADRIVTDKDASYILYKRLNGVIILLAIMVAVFCCYFMFETLRIENFKICCSLKAGMISIALYALYEQWFGEE